MMAPCQTSEGEFWAIIGGEGVAAAATLCLPLSVPCREMKGALRLMHIYRSGTVKVATDHVLDYQKNPTESLPEIAKC